MIPPEPRRPPLRLGLARLGPAPIALAFLLVAMVIAFAAPLADDEGRLTYIAARGLGESFWDFLFFAKMRPAGSLLYALPALLGWPAVVAVHVALASLAVYLLGRTSEALGGSGPLASLVVAASPAFAAAAVTGQSNTDGIACMAAVLYSFFVRRSLLVAGLLLGVAPFVRYEFAIFAAGMAVYGLAATRSRRFALGLVAFPTLYLGAGALFHGDLLWILRFPPTLPVPVPGAGDFAGVTLEVGYLVTLPTLAALVSPAWVLLALVDLRALSPAARALAVMLGVTAAAMVLIPFTGALNFEHSARYWLVLLPFLALLVAQGPPAVSLRGWSPPVMLLATVGIVVLASGPQGASVVPAALLLAPVALIVAWAASRRVTARAATVALVLGGLCALVPTGGPLDVLKPSKVSGDLRAAIRWLAPRSAALVYSNSRHFDAAVQRWAPELGESVRFLPPDTMLYELYTLGHRGTGQYDAGLAALSEHGYGTAAWPCRFPAPDEPLAAAWFVLDTDDDAHERTYPRRFMDAISVEQARFGDVSVRRGRPLSTSQLHALRVQRVAPALLAPCGLRPPAAPAG